MNISGVAITGHTSGVGAILEQYYRTAPINLLLYSRSNGYDLNDKSIRDTIIKELIQSKVDIFYNNAYCDSQVDLLYEVFEAWRHEPKLIVNMCSINHSLTNPKGIPQSRYSVDKHALYNASNHLRTLDRQCKILTVIPGIIDTAYNQNKQVPKMTLTDALDIIIDAVETNTSKTIEIQEIKFEIKA